MPMQVVHYDSDNDDVDANAGSAFSGREEKKQAKKRNKK
jgi:hypothetical protein